MKRFGKSIPDAFILIHALLLASLVIGCQKRETHEKTGVFEEVIAHYQANVSDSLQVKAAQYLAEYIDGQYSYVGAGVNVYKEFSDNMQELHRSRVGDEFNTDSIIRSGIAKIEERRGPALLQTQFDRDFLTKEFLIDNIDNAFKAWRMFPWSKEVGFDDFCEYILPYKVFQEPVSPGWRASLMDEYRWVLDSLRDPKDLIEVTLLLNKGIRKKMEYSAAMNALPTVFTPDDLTKIRYGNCLQLVTYTTYVLRAMGVPAMIDFTPTWGNNSSGHTWGAIKVKGTLFTYDAIYTDAQVAGLEKTNVIPEAVLRNRKTPKIYRYSYKRHPLTLNGGNHHIPAEFRNEYVSDVTRQYAHSVTSHVMHLDSSLNDTPLFLSVYNRNSWKVAVLGKKIGERAYRFDDIGTGMVYLPSIIQGSKIVPISSPFLLQADSVKVFSAARDMKRKLILYRKSNIDYDLTIALNNTVGGIFEGSNDLYFTDSQQLYKIESRPLACTNTFPVKNKGLYRYIRFVQPNGPCRLAEFKVYGKYRRNKMHAETKTSLVRGKLISSDYSGENRPTNVIDRNVLTYFVSKASTNGYVGFDVGDSARVQVDVIDFYPPNDGNSVEVGDCYQLCYWADEWKSLGEQVAKNEHVVFKNCPENAIFRLRNLTKGYKERIFSYENGRQIWW